MTNNAVPPKAQWELDHEEALRQHAMTIEDDRQKYLDRIYPQEARKQTKPAGNALLGYCGLWAVFSIPGTLLAVSHDYGVGLTLLGGVIYTVVGNFWAGLFHGNFWLRWSPAFIGLSMMATAILSLFIPLGALLIVAVCGAPFGVSWLLKENPK